MSGEAAADKAQEGSHQLAITRPDRPSAEARFTHTRRRLPRRL